MKNMRRQIKFKNKLKHLPFRPSKMKLFLPALIFGIVSTFCFSQDDLVIFEHLTSKTWMAEGEWGDGSLFKQESKFSFALDSTLVLVKSKRLYQSRTN